MTPDPAATPAPPRARRFFRRHKLLATFLALMLLGAAVGIAVVLWSQDLTATPNTRTSPVVFAAGDDADDLDALDFIGASDPVVSANGAAASFTPFGIPGATSLSLGEVVELRNADTADDQDYGITLSVSGTPAATLTAFTVSFVDDTAGTVTWDLLAGSPVGPYTLDDGETWEFTVSSLKMTALASGSQGALTLSASMAPTP